MAETTDRAILFHSATGKDSLVMLDLMAPFFKEIVCVYMYIVPNLRSVTGQDDASQYRYFSTFSLLAPLTS